MTADSTTWSRVEKYSPLSGKFIREIRPCDFFEIASTAGTTPSVSGDFTLCSGTTDANSELYITAVGYATTNKTTFVVVKGTSTIMPVWVNDNSNVNIIGTYDAPLGKVEKSTTVSIIAKNATTTGTYTAYLVARREPIESKIEPEQF